MRGHEFHYSEIKERTQNVKHRTQTEDIIPPTRLLLKEGVEGFSAIYSVKNGRGQHFYDEGYTVKNILASYAHIHFGSNPAIANNFIKFLRNI